MSAMATTREKLIESGLFMETTSRDLVAEFPESETENIRMTFEFDPFGELVHLSAHIVSKPLAEMVAQNRRALGLPPQHSVEAGHL